MSWSRSTVAVAIHKCVLLTVGVLAGLSVCCVHRVHAAEKDLTTLTHSTVIRASKAELWQVFATAQGMQRWMAPRVEIDLRVGGTIRSSYDPTSDLEDDRTIVNTILALAPERLLALRCTQVPAGFPFRDEIQDTWSVILLEELGPERTRVTFQGMGYTADEGSQRMRAFFQQGNQHVIQQLAALFARPDAAGQDARVLELLARLTAGEWVHETVRPDGSRFHVRNTATHGPDGVSIVARGWLDLGPGPFEHAAILIHRIPEASGGGVEFTSVHENGTVARGPIRLLDDQTVEWHWPEQTLDGRTGLYRIRMRFDEDAYYTMLMHEQRPDGTLHERLNLRFRRGGERTPSEDAASESPGSRTASSDEPAQGGTPPVGGQ